MPNYVKRVDEGILLDREDHVISAIAANVFLVVEDRLLTPRLDPCGVRGVFVAIYWRVLVHAANNAASSGYAAGGR